MVDFIRSQTSPDDREWDRHAKTFFRGYLNTQTNGIFTAELLLYFENNYPVVVAFGGWKDLVVYNVER